MGQSTKQHNQAIFGVVAIMMIFFVIAIYLVAGPSSLTIHQDVKPGQQSDDGEVIFREVGSSATVDLNSFTGEWSGAETKTAVTPDLTITTAGNN